MSNSDNPQINLKAYRVFINELQRHMDWVLTQLEGSSFDENVLQEAAQRFHTIKGGAGFFGLSEVERLACRLENKFIKNGSSSSCIDQRAVFELLESLQKQLCSLGGSNTAFKNDSQSVRQYKDE